MEHLHHIALLKEQMAPGMQLEAICQDAKSAVDALPDESLDAILCLGPMYHLRATPTPGVLQPLVVCVPVTAYPTSARTWVHSPFGHQQRKEG